MIKLASQFKKPSSADKLQSLVKPINDAIMEAGKIADSNRSSPLFNHLTFVKDGLMTLSWVLVEPKPCPYITEMRDACQFYGNRVLKEYKDKEKSHVDWVQSYVTLLNDLHAYVKKFHLTGLVWNSKAEAEATAVALASSAAGPAAPPPPPAGFFDESKPAAAAAATTTAPSMNSVFSQLSVGEKITSGLKKVEKSQMTHKNPELRASGVVKDVPKPSSQGK